MEGIEEQRPERDVPRWLVRGAGWAWRLLVVALAVALVLYLTSRLVVVVAPVIAGLFGAALLVPAVDWLEGHRIRRLLATWLVFVAGLVVILGLALWIIPAVSREATQLAAMLSAGVGRVRSWLTVGPLHVSKAEVDSFVAKIRTEASAQSGAILHGAVAGAQLLLEALAAAILAVVLTFFFVKDGSALGTWILGFVDPLRRPSLQGAAEAAWGTFTAYVQGSAINGAINGVLMGVGLLLIGVPLALPIAVLTAFGGFFPLVGGIISGVLAILVALVAKGAGGALLVLLLTVLIHNVEGYLVGPFVLGRRLRLHPVVVILSLAAGTVLGGVFGAFVAVPLVAVMLTLIEYYRGLPRAIVTTSSRARSLPRTRLAVVRAWSRRDRTRKNQLAPIADGDSIQPGPLDDEASS
jgi:putative heme transporter